MKARFEGEAGRRVLIDSLKGQKLVGGNQALAEEIAAIGDLIELDKNATIMEQGAPDKDIYLILAGAFVARVNGKKVATRFPNDSIGEMAAVQPSQRRSASVVAMLCCRTSCSCEVK